METERLQFPFVVPFLCEDPLWDEIGLCRKTSFQDLKNCIFRTCLHCFQSTQNQYLGTWSIVLLQYLDENKPSVGLSGASAALGFHLADPSRLKADTLTTESQGPCVRRILPSYSLSGLAARGWGPGLWLQKNNFWRPLFFWQCPCETQKWDVATLLSLSPGQPIRQSPALPN